MPGLLNDNRPPVFCPGCSHDRVVRALDRALQQKGLQGNQVAIVSDIGCSGLVDTFFHTHALHGLHGRALTYAAGIKLARPELQVIVTMGDGGLGIGGAHLLAACRRNLDLTLLLLNNFNFGMTGGQFSATTPPESSVGSDFLNSLERPMDAAQVAASAGAPFVLRSSAYSKGLADDLQQAMDFPGFSLIDIWGICTGRYSKRNTITPGVIEENLKELPSFTGRVETNLRPEYARSYQEKSSSLSKPELPQKIDPVLEAPERERREIVLLGAAGQRVVTAGELLFIAGLTAGHQATQKNDYPITVLTGHSVSEVILSPQTIHYTGITSPSLVIALAQEGANRRKRLFSKLGAMSTVLKVPGLNLPQAEARMTEVDFKARGIMEPDWALAALAFLAAREQAISLPMLQAAVEKRFQGRVLESSLGVIERVSAG